MIFNLDVLTDASAPRRYDVCVIGGGAAGITLAKKLADLGKTVALCEGGSDGYEGDSQDIYAGDVVGDPYYDLDAARLRFFGGSTNHWAGKCRSFEEADFDRAHLGPEFEWPIGKSAFDAYLEEAGEVLNIRTSFNDEVVDEEFGIKRFVFRHSSVNFGEKFRDFFDASDKADLYLNANLTALTLQEGTRRITSAGFTGYSDSQMEIAADSVVFAMGGIENSRQLLYFHRQLGDQLYNAALPVGQYWMEHPHFNLGEALVSRRVQELGLISLTGPIQKKLGILACGFRVDIQGGTATRRLVKNLLCVAPNLGTHIANLAEKNLVCGVRLKAAWEQAPAASNAVKLHGSKVDRFGVPLSELHWAKTDLDRLTMAKSTWQFAQYCMQRGYGRFKMQDWIMTGGDYPSNDELAGFHHMGGTRMAKTAALGVVDADCKVFGTENLYMAGSSVFTTAGHNNPTLPIVQLALRLGDHLAGQGAQ